MASERDVDIDMESQEEEEDNDDGLPEAFEAELVPIINRVYDCGCLEILQIGGVACVVIVSVLSVLFVPLAVWHFMSKWFPQ